MENKRAIYKKLRLINAFFDQQNVLDDVDKKSDAINALNYDVLALVFMNLPIPERIVIEDVCSKWKEACQVAWHDIKVYKCGVSIGRAYDNRLLSQSYVEKILLRCGVYLNELILSEVCNSSIMTMVGNRCHNLTKLEFVFDETSVVANANDYIFAFTQLQKLEYIKIQVTTIKNKHSTNFPVEIINCLQEGMKEIHLFFNIWSKEKEPLFINFGKFQQLHSLTIRFCNLNNMIEGISKKSKLVYLDMRKSWLEIGSLVFDELVNLEHIDLPNRPYTMVGPQVLTSIFNICKNLKYLEMPRSYDLREPEIPFANLMNLVNLVHLSTSWRISQDFATNIFKYCKKLKYLSIQSATESAMEKLTKLESLECLKFHTEDRVSKETIISISKNCKKIKHLEIPYLQFAQYNDDEPNTVSLVLNELSNLEHLEYLNLENCILLQGSSLVAIANKCKHLKYLNVGESNRLTKLSYNSLTSLENLQELTVGCTLAVTNDFVKKLKGLKVFNCDRCSRITDSSLIQLIKNCPDLEQLSLRDVINITIHTIVAADVATKNRNSGIVLHIRISDEEIYRAAGLFVRSQWLVIDYDDSPFTFNYNLHNYLLNYV